jgi:hypothetical protein
MCWGWDGGWCRFDSPLPNPITSSYDGGGSSSSMVASSWDQRGSKKRIWKVFFVLLVLKGLSYEIDFDNVDKNWQILGFIRAATGFWFFRRDLWFLVELKYLLSGKC